MGGYEIEGRGSVIDHDRWEREDREKARQDMIKAWRNEVDSRLDKLEKRMATLETHEALKLTEE